MSEPHPAVRVLAVPGPLLTEGAVVQLQRELEGETRPTLLDCEALTAVSAAGLAALLELGRSTGPDRRLALSGLGRALTRIAIQASLARHFAIYVSCAAFLRAQPLPEASVPCAP